MIKIPDLGRIERLISGYDLSLHDLPRRYRSKDRKIALDMINLWGGTNTYTRNNIDYICHLMAMIDLLVRALESSQMGVMQDAGQGVSRYAGAKRPKTQNYED